MLGIMFNATSKSEHEPVVERAIQTLKATARSIVNALPYRPCAVLVVYLVYYATSCVNMFPRKGGIGDLSPRQLVLGRPIDMAVEGRLPFGAFVHMHEDASSNGMEARTVGAIALGPCGNTQGGYRFLSLTSWRVVTRRAWTELPMPQEIIDLLNSKAKDEARRGGAPDGTLRFTLQGCPLPDEDVEAPDDNDEDITAELIADLRLVEPGAIEHTNPIETVERVDDNPDADVSTDDARSQPEAPSQMVMDANPNAESMSEEESTAEPPHDPPPSQDVTSYIPPHGYNTRYQRRVSSEYATVLRTICCESLRRGQSRRQSSQGTQPTARQGRLAPCTFRPPVEHAPQPNSLLLLFHKGETRRKPQVPSGQHGKQTKRSSVLRRND